VEVLRSWGLLLALCGCGRLGFDDVVGGGPGTDPDAGSDTQPMSDMAEVADGWTEVTFVSASNLYAVTAFAANNIWVAGDNGITMQYDDSQWIDRGGPTQDVYALWGTANDLWEVGAFCEMQRWNGSMWNAVTVPNCGGASLNGIAGAAANDFWIVGVAGTIFNYVNGTFTGHSEQANVDLFGVWAVSTTDVYVVGTRGLIMHYSSGTPLDEQVPLNVTLRSVWGANANDVWVVGDSGTIYRKQNGGLWVKQASPVSSILYRLWGTAANDVWAVGDLGVVIHFDGTSWQTVTMPTTDTLRAMTGVPSGGMRIVGHNGVVLAHP
jgi:trimeric autotransporter adhesin